jgi:hypothetical protein
MTTRGDREEDVWLSDAQLSKLARADSDGIWSIEGQRITNPRPASDPYA